VANRITAPAAEIRNTDIAVFQLFFGIPFFSPAGGKQIDFGFPLRATETIYVSRGGVGNVTLYFTDDVAG